MREKEMELIKKLALPFLSFTLAFFFLFLRNDV